MLGLSWPELMLDLIIFIVASLIRDDRVQGHVSRDRQVSGRCRFGIGRSICHVGDQADDSRSDGEDDRVGG